MEQRQARIQALPQIQGIGSAESVPLAIKLTTCAFDEPAPLSWLPKFQMREGQGTSPHRKCFLSLLSFETRTHKAKTISNASFVIDMYFDQPALLSRLKKFQTQYTKVYTGSTKVSFLSESSSDRIPGMETTSEADCTLRRVRSSRRARLW